MIFSLYLDFLNQKIKMITIKSNYFLLLSQFSHLGEKIVTKQLRWAQPNLLLSEDRCEALRDSHNYGAANRTIITSHTVSQVPSNAKWRAVAFCCMILSETPEVAGQKMHEMQINWGQALNGWVNSLIPISALLEESWPRAAFIYFGNCVI